MHNDVGAAHNNSLSNYVENMHQCMQSQQVACAAAALLFDCCARCLRHGRPARWHDMLPKHCPSTLSLQETPFYEQNQKKILFAFLILHVPVTPWYIATCSWI